MIGVLAVLVLIAAVVVVVVALHGSNHTSSSATGKRHHRKGQPSSSSTSPTTTSPPASETDAYRTSGNQILGPNGAPYLAYGITIFGLSDSGWQQGYHSDLADIAAIAHDWHSNTVRIQIAPSILMSGSSVNSTMLSDLESEVSTAEGDGLNVIICPQYERTTKMKMPQQSTAQFWQLIAPHYRSDGRVWFDLFNEPQLGIGQAGGVSGLWNIWQNGGKGYIGMQTLVNDIRATGAQNLILAEGVDGAKSLTDLPSHMLTGTNVAYAVHPYFDGPQFSSPAAWQSNWGFLTPTVPIVADEWSEYEKTGATCTTTAPSLVPQFLSFISQHNIGLIGWGLIPGVLVHGSDLAAPTTFSAPASFTCQNGSSNAQGPGQLMLQYFAQHDTAAAPS